MALASHILKKAEFWAHSPLFDAETRDEIAALLKARDEQSLLERFERDLKFGTAGLRGVLGSGSSRMNFYNVRKATHAVGLYLKEREGQRSGPLRVAISYDCRHFSKDFAQTVAEVLAAQGIHSFLTTQLGPAPLLSFMVRELEADLGIYITASHNPAQYNGYKVYLPTGGQIVPPHDEQITRHFVATEYDQLRFQPLDEAIREKKVTWVGEEMIEKYLDRLQKEQLFNKNESLRLIYTPLHGTGLRVLPRALSSFGFKNVVLVDAQCAYDGSFPTVKSPNPGEATSLALAIAEATKEKADLVLATDPDADRLGIAVSTENGYEAIEGNALGSLLIDFVLSQKKIAGNLPSHPLVIKTIVTTDMQRSIAESYGATVEETLTGFKWIAERIEEYESGKRKPYRRYICGGEEAYGFLLDSFIRDKDGISACLVAAQMMAFYKSRGMGLDGALEELYIRYGYYFEDLKTIVAEGVRGEKAMADFLKSLREDPPSEIAGFNVKKWRDFFTGTESVAPFEKTQAIDFPKSDVLQFYLEGEARLSIRPSGTEPLMKYYLSVKAPVADREALPQAKKESQKKADEILAWLNKRAEPFLKSG